MGKKVKIDGYFLSEKCPFSGRRKPNWKRIRLLSFLALGGLVVGLLFVSPTPEKTTAAIAAATPKSAASQPPAAGGDSDYLQRQTIPDTFSSSRGGGRAPRQYTAS